MSSKEEEEEKAVASGDSSGEGRKEGRRRKYAWRRRSVDRLPSVRLFCVWRVMPSRPSEEDEDNGHSVNEGEVLWCQECRRRACY